jgi:hypothetical protein
LDKSDSTEVRRACVKQRVAPSRNEVKSCSTDCCVVDVARPAVDAGGAAAPSPAPALAATASAPSVEPRWFVNSADLSELSRVPEKFLPWVKHIPLPRRSTSERGYRERTSPSSTR